jgi:hypothetical protein
MEGPDFNAFEVRAVISGDRKLEAIVMTSPAYRMRDNASALSDGSPVLAWREPPGRLGDFVRRIKAYHQIPADPAWPCAGDVYLASVRASDSAAAISA